MNLIFVFISTFLDAYLYGYCYENQIKKENNPAGIFSGKISASLYNLFKPVIKFLFIEWKPFKESWVPFYRVLIQWQIDFWGLYFTYKITGIVPFIGSLIAIFLCEKEFGFYKLLGQIDLTKTYTNPYWLKRPYFIFGWVEYDPILFDKCFKWGFWILIASNMPYLVNLLINWLI
jgi:hypothetical protein